MRRGCATELNTPMEPVAGSRAIGSVVRAETFVEHALLGVHSRFQGNDHRRDKDETENPTVTPAPRR